MTHLWRTLKRQGWTLEIQRGGYWRATHPDLGPGEFLAIRPGDRWTDARTLAVARRMIRTARKDVR